VNLPKIEIRKITETKPDGYAQYTLTLPKDFAKSLKAKGITSLYIIYDEILMAFPFGLVTEQEILTFLKAHPEIEKLLTKEA
jgi:ATP:corrinoid adenosyltransferase